MKELLALILVGLVAVLAYPAVDVDNDLDSDWVLIPDTDWNMHLVNIKDPQFEDLESKKAMVVKFILYTRDNPKEGQVIQNGDVETLRKSHFNGKNPTRIICHGWLGNTESIENELCREKYLERGEYNIIVMDWSSGAGINYIRASKNTMEAGKQAAKFIDFLNEHAGMDFNTLYLIGYSLGAHVVGIAGKCVTRGHVNTIFGLDPASPLFSVSSPNKRLDAADADYVETIHTNGGLLGMHHPIGKAAFYPNWGKLQPGCSSFLGICSHERARLYFAESLTNDQKFVAQQCKGFKDILNKYCNSAGAFARMGGEPSNYGRNVNGEFYLETNYIKPYDLGLWWVK